MKTILLTFIIIFSLPVFSQTRNLRAPIKRYSIEQFYKNIRYDGGVFSTDESKILVSSDKSGIFNVYEIDIKSGWIKQLTFSKTDSYFAIDYVPGTNQIIYSADKGGNEIYHIYLLKEDGTSTDLTPGEKVKVKFIDWSHDKKAFYYTSNKRNKKFKDLYKMKVSDFSSEMLYQNDEGLNIAGISNDENIFALKRTLAVGINKLYLLDRTKNKKTEISDEEGGYGSSGFSIDNRYFYYITDVGKEYAYLVDYEIATGKRKTLYSTNWNVVYSYLSKTGKYRVIAINEDGKNKLIIIDNTTNKEIDFPEINDGNIRKVSISDSEEKLRLTIGTSTNPDNLYVYNLADKSLKKLTESLNQQIKQRDLVAAKVVRYKSFDGLEIPAIFYKPHLLSAKEKVPALVWVHGGPGEQTKVGYSALIQYLVNHGYAILAVNNRGSSGYGKTFYKMDDRNHGDKDLKDCIWGKKWLQSQDYIDPDKIGIIGGSYGGYLTMAAMTFTPDEFKAGVNIFGVTNWLRTLKSIPPHWESFRKALYTELGDPYTADSVRLYEISPLFHAENVKNPVLVLQGANDPRVLKVESDEIVEALRKNNVPVEYIVFPDEGHGFLKKENEIKGYSKILEFLNKYLKETK